VPWLFLASAFVVATCGLVYELIAGTLASYLLGDSVTQFSTVIGTYLFAMGVGSWLSRYFTRRVVQAFIQIEILIGAVGGCSAAALFYVFDYVDHFRIVLYGLVMLIGMLVGLEIPLLLRILKDKFEFSDLISRVLTVDYVGALIASLLFPLFLVPQLGLIRTSFLVGFMNTAVAVVLILMLPERRRLLPHLASAIAVLIGLGLGCFYGPAITNAAEAHALPGNLIYAHTTPYQRIVLTSANNELRLFLNGNLQFSTRDEYRYHESLVHPLLSGRPRRQDILILGGGDGMAAREALKYPDVASITLVDLDPAMTRLFSHNDFLQKLNANSLNSPKLHVINDDALIWLKRNQRKFDAAIVDFPDPSNYSLGKLYTVTFYNLLFQALADDGTAVIQTTSPYVARKSFWCVVKTVEAAGFHSHPYHALVPSFGEWGFVLVAKGDYQIPQRLPSGLKFLSTDSLPAMFVFPTDMARVDTEVNRLDNQRLVRYFDAEWGDYVTN
jgi:spermidine synthase